RAVPDRLALIIANDKFDDPNLTRLATPSRDAEALAAVLRDPAIGGFDVTLFVNSTMRDVRRAIVRLYQHRTKDDLLLLYYSGHGVKDDYGDLYLITRDTDFASVSAASVDAAFVRGQIDKSHSQRKVVILDCCHSGAFTPGIKSVLGGNAGAQEMLTGNGYGRVIITASNAVEYAWEGERLLGAGDGVGMSMFTHFLVQGLQTGAADLDGDGQISLDELYDYVYKQVITSGQARQTPQKSVYKGEGRIAIARNPYRVGLPYGLQQAIESPFGGVRAGAVSELERLLRGRDPDLALAARVALQRLMGDDSRRDVATVSRTLDGAPAVVSTVSPVTRETVQRSEYQTLTLSAPDVLTITAPIRQELVRVPAGEFLMGSDPAKDKDAYGDEQPPHQVYVPEFYIGRSPVTNEQYAAFVKATGHIVPEHWKGAKIPLGRENHPVVNVSWHDARAFCEWLSRETGQDFRLPMEAEWEKAARGTDGRLWPWGDEFDTARCNTGESGSGGTTPVGQYSPVGDSPCGCADMAGNVWEWTSSLMEGYPYQADDGREDPGGSAPRVLRGGSFRGLARDARCACRGGYSPGARIRYSGFRCGWGVSSISGY
ncbi:MAG: SUMF1/EgtB/PvdO family nonheme iron enzyme, partial [Chloroflexi bacterium]|nr:SUMF1/EgtB/PvdO family nonheme iron enzyme [Chloroflexota bacterium]